MPIFSCLAIFFLSSAGMKIQDSSPSITAVPVRTKMMRQPTWTSRKRPITAARMPPSVGQETELTESTHDRAARRLGGCAHAWRQVFARPFPGWPASGGAGSPCLGQSDTALQKESADPVDRRCATMYQPVSHHGEARRPVATPPGGRKERCRRSLRYHQTVNVMLSIHSWIAVPEEFPSSWTSVPMVGPQPLLRAEYVAFSTVGFPSITSV